MARDEAYLEAERKIEGARRSGASVLSLDHMGLTELPESLGQLAQLESLYLSSNRLTVLPESLRELTQLRTLNLMGNLLSDLPLGFPNLTNLRSLGLGDGTGGNPLRSFPSVIRELIQLDDLWVGHRVPHRHAPLRVHLLEPLPLGGQLLHDVVAVEDRLEVHPRALALEPLLPALGHD